MLGWLTGDTNAVFLQTSFRVSVLCLAYSLVDMSRAPLTQCAADQILKQNLMQLRSSAHLACTAASSRGRYGYIGSAQ
jgi:hypothetical protein